MNFTAFLFRLLLAVAVCLPAGGWAADKKKIGPEPPPPLAQSQKIRVRRGTTVEIPLKIHGVRLQTIEYRVTQPPRLGKVGGIRQATQESALVSYTAPDELRTTQDIFFFTAKSRQGVSAPVPVQIELWDAEPKLRVVRTLDFGSVPPGESASRIFEISNVGGGLATGEVTTSEPFQISGGSSYSLRNGESTTFVVLYRPISAGTHSVAVQFSSEPGAQLGLEGISRIPLEITPAVVALEKEVNGSRRVGTVRIANTSDSALNVQAKVSDARLTVAPELILAPKAETTVAFETKAEDVTELKTELVLRVGGADLKVPVNAAPLPAKLIAWPAAAALGRVTAGEQRAACEVENHGGMPGEFSIKVSGPFSAPQRLTLAAGERRTLNISATTDAHGAVKGSLLIEGAGHRLEVPVSAELPEVTPVVISGQRAPALIRAQELEPVSDRHSGPPPAEIPGSRVRFVSRAGGTVTLAWQVALVDTKHFAVQREEMKNENRKFTLEWKTWTGTTIEQRGAEWFATVQNLPLGATESLRVVALDNEGQEVEVLGEGAVYLPLPPQKSRWPWVAGGVALLAALGFFLRKKFLR